MNDSYKCVQKSVTVAANNVFFVPAICSQWNTWLVCCQTSNSTVTAQQSRAKVMVTEKCHQNSKSIQFTTVKVKFSGSVH